MEKPQWIRDVEATASGNFDVVDAAKKLEISRNERSTSGWDDAADKGWRIRDNNLPLGKPAGMPNNWKGKYYVDNWLAKGIRFKVSMLTGGDVEIDAKPVDGYNYRTPTDIEADPVDLLDSEINSNWEVMNATKANESKLYDWFYTGIGVNRGIWDVEDVTPMFLTGTPRTEHVDSRQIFLDPAARDPYLNDMRYFFHEEYYDMAKLRKEYPKFYDDINEDIPEDRINATDTVKIVTMQFKETNRLKKVYFEDTYSGIHWDIPYEEYQLDLEEARVNPEYIALYEQTDKSIEFEDWIQQGGYLPEKVRIVGIITTKQTCAFQTIFLSGKKTLLIQTPQYIGKDYSYFFICGNQHSNTAYPFGIVIDEMADLQEIDIAATTIYTMMLFKYYMTKPMIQAGSLLNYDDYIKNFHKVDSIPLVDPAWQMKHPNVSAVEYMPLPDPPRAFMQLHDRIVEAQKSLTGAFESAMGKADYSGQSGTAIASLQAASTNYQREDIEKYRSSIEDEAIWLKEQIIIHRNYPHETKTLDETGAEQMYPVATNETNKLTPDICYLKVTIEANQEITRQIEQQLALDLFDRRLAGNLDTLRKLPVNNPDRVNDNRMQEDGTMRIKEMIDASGLDPQTVEQVFQQVLAQAQQSTQQNSTGTQE